LFPFPELVEGNNVLRGPFDKLRERESELRERESKLGDRRERRSGAPLSAHGEHSDMPEAAPIDSTTSDN
jgi:hypothetical protein